jgi:YaiO family outer membrane protein
MKKRLGFITILFIIAVISTHVCLAETTEQLSDNSGQYIATTPTIESNEAKSENAVPLKRNFHFEIGGSYSNVDNGDDRWKALDLRLTYSGSDKITPFGSISTLHRDAGSQRVYALGSYIHFNPKFYMIAGISGAPVKNPNVILYPKLRLDLSGYYCTPMLYGLVLTTGITHFPKQNGNGGDIISIGSLYYGKVILSGSLNYNIAQPGNITSFSGQAGIMYGAQGKYWVGGGASTGRVAYQLATAIPFDVRYKSRGINMFYSRWLDNNWGINTRFDYAELVVGKSKLIGITTSLFIDF